MNGTGFSVTAQDAGASYRVGQEVLRLLGLHSLCYHWRLERHDESASNELGTTPLTEGTRHASSI